MDLYISDLDGTLLNSQEKVSMETISILNTLIEKGLNFSIATARSINSARKIIEPLNLKLPIVLNNGVYVYDPVSKKNILSNFISNKTAFNILNTCDEFKLSPFLFTADEISGDKVFYRGLFNNGEKEFVNSRVLNGDKRFNLVNNFPNVKDMNVVSIVLIGEDVNLRSLYYELKEKYDLTYHYTEDIYSKFYWLEVTNKGADKKSGIQYLKQYLKAKKLICFGDNLNDCSMFEIADEKYAVSNAHHILKSCATKVIGSNEDHAVAKFIKNTWSA